MSTQFETSFGEDNRTRTYDPLHVKQVLYQLSYTLITLLLYTIFFRLSIEKYRRLPHGILNAKSYITKSMIIPDSAPII